MQAFYLSLGRRSFYMVKVIIIALVVTIIGIASFAAVEKSRTATTDTTGNNTTSADEDKIIVSISGEVVKNYPNGGTYTLSLESSLLDLIIAAGGVTTNADPKAYNSDFILENKMSFYIAPLYDNTNTCSTEPIQKVNINTDDKATLMEVGSIGSTIASAIISYRESNGPFERIEELKNVSGIGNATFEKIKNFVQILE